MTQSAHILLVDDEASVLLALKLMLEAFGFTVTDFADSHDALDYLIGGGSCDLFLCDKQMRNSDGIKVLERSKQIRPTLPFVLMSGAVSDEESKLAHKKGASGFLSKPFEPAELKSLVAKLVTPKA